MTTSQAEQKRENKRQALRNIGLADDTAWSVMSSEQKAAYHSESMRLYHQRKGNGTQLATTKPHKLSKATGLTVQQIMHASHTPSNGVTTDEKSSARATRTRAVKNQRTTSPGVATAMKHDQPFKVTMKDLPVSVTPDQPSTKVTLKGADGWLWGAIGVGVTAIGVLIGLPLWLSRHLPAA